MDGFFFFFFFVAIDRARPSLVLTVHACEEAAVWIGEKAFTVDAVKATKSEHRRSGDWNILETLVSSKKCLFVMVMVNTRLRLRLRLRFRSRKQETLFLSRTDVIELMDLF